MAAWSEHEDGPWVETRSALGRKVSTPRKHSKYQLCERHAPWFAGQGRTRTLECFVEGGPGGWSPGCEGGECRLWPGTDVFEESVCHGELELEWTESVSTPLPTPCPKCQRAMVDECPDCVDAEPFPTEVWTFFSDSDLDQLVTDACAEMGRREMGRKS